MKPTIALLVAILCPLAGISAKPAPPSEASPPTVRLGTPGVADSHAVVRMGDIAEHATSLAAADSPIEAAGTGASAGMMSPLPAQSFAGPSDASGTLDGSPHGAIGPDHIVTVSALGKMIVQDRARTVLGTVNVLEFNPSQS